MIEVKNKYLQNFTFIDLFAGIGGFHQALSSYGGKCVFASEWDIHAQNTYKENFGIDVNGDITKIDEKDIPKHDIICGGFPCQAFSVSGKQLGFDDTRGTLFFDIVRIANYHKPKVLFLENVRNLYKHDNGNTFNIILKTLNDIGYNVYFEILNTSNYGLPQNRERVYIVCFRKDIDSSKFKFPKSINVKTCLEDILENDPIDGKIIEREDIKISKNIEIQNDLFGVPILLNKPIQIGIVNKGGQGERIYHSKGHSITLSAYGGGVGAKTGLYLIDDKIRKLSPRECARLQGFPDTFKINKKINQAYKQFGNSVSIDVLQHILNNISIVLKKDKNE